MDNLVVAAFLEPVALGVDSRGYRLMTTPANLFENHVRGRAGMAVVGIKGVRPVFPGVNLSEAILAQCLLPVLALHHQDILAHHLSMRKLETVGQLCVVCAWKRMNTENSEQLRALRVKVSARMAQRILF